MKMLGVSNHVMKGKRHSKRNKKDVKVTYISSPMKVKTSASQFRELVQELTGQYSNVAEMFVEANNDDAHDAAVHKGSSNQQWSADDAYLLEPNWLKPGYNEFHSRSSSEQLNRQFPYELFSFDTLY
ncbi:uncharacterized protein LOC113856444 [Abrus precatorius]|uniref:Uncharacterized protein LOC113856444 n=1 Tax=Abrus precatorius TaxID=3816 RepID=A0A8B8KJS5_ABRPR|nr:uncharacterized protein LOC113856444 [Abrus precatorius]